MAVKLSTKLPKDSNANGLDAGESRFLSHPIDQLVIIAYVSTQKIVTNYDDGSREPTITLDAVEIIGDQHDVPAAVRAAFEAAHDHRVNRSPKLPTEPEPEATLICSRCGHGEDEHQADEGCQGHAELETPCETCGHPMADHDLDDGRCWADKACACVNPSTTDQD